MLQTYLLALYCLVPLALTANIPSIANLQQLNVTDPCILSNPKGIGSPIDGRLTADFVDGQDVLPDKSIFMNGLKAMRQISANDFAGPCPRGTWSFPGYHDVEIVIVPARGTTTTFQWRHALFGIYLAINRSSTQNFVSMSAFLHWRGIAGKETIGACFIRRARTPTGVVTINSSSAIDDRQQFPALSLAPSLAPNYTATLLSTNQKSSLNLGTIETGDVNLAIDPTGGRVSKTGVFLSLYIAICHYAGLSQTTPVPDQLKVVVACAGMSLMIEPWAEPRTSPPFFLPAIAIRAIVRIPTYMYQNKKFNEVRFVIETEAVPVGYGWIRNRVD